MIKTKIYNKNGYLRHMTEQVRTAIIREAYDKIQESDLFSGIEG